MNPRFFIIISSFYSNVEDQAKLNLEFARFSKMGKDFSDVASIMARYNEDAKGWWAPINCF